VGTRLKFRVDASQEVAKFSTVTIASKGAGSASEPELVESNYPLGWHRSMMVDKGKQ